MRARVFATVAGVAILGAATNAAAEVDSWTPEERGGPPANPPAQTAPPAPRPSPAIAAPAPVAAPIANANANANATPNANANANANATPTTTPTTTPTAPPATAAAPEQPGTVTITMPPQRFELGARFGALAGGEVTPKGFAQGHVQPSWIAIVDFDFIAHPFFTIGAFTHLSNQDIEQYVNGTKSGEGNFFLASVGVSAKGRIPISENVVGTVGIYAGRNFISASVAPPGGGKSTDVSGGGFNMGLSAELAFAVAKQVAIVTQGGFLSQISGSVATDGGSDHDLAFKPMVFLTLGPEVRF